MYAWIGVCTPWNWQETLGESSVCVHTRAYKKEWTFNMFPQTSDDASTKWSLCRDAGKPWVEAIVLCVNKNNM